MTKITVNCRWCEKDFEAEAKEIRRQLKKGKVNFFCNNVCSGFHRGATRLDRIVDIDKECQLCHTVFKTHTGQHEAMFCSRSCASAGSVTDYRRRRAAEVGRATGRDNLKYGLDNTALLMKSREAWKYVELRKYLEFHSIPFEFEKAIGTGIRDLALIDFRIIVEFDGPEHRSTQAVDTLRDKEAEDLGWAVHRVCVEPASVIPTSVLFSILPRSRTVAPLPQ